MTTVNHTTFGTGTILSNDLKTVTVDFNNQTKVLLIKFAGLKNADGSPWVPAKVKSAKTKSYSFSEICKEDKDFLIRTGVVDLNGNTVDSEVDSLINAKKEIKTGEWA